MTTALSPDGSLRLVIFDCDGVLIDSERVCCRLIAADARRLGLDVPDEKAVGTFGGKALPVIREDLERESGKTLPEDWTEKKKKEFITSFRKTADVIDGAPQMLEAVRALGLPVRVASNSSHEEMEAKFTTADFLRYFEGRIHSAVQMNAPKPAPDVYLQAAKEEGVQPAECVVLEDSDTGARAAVAAGMTCVLLRAADAPAPDWPGLVRIEKLSEFPVLLRNALHAQGRL